ncbi:unnamed protein product [Linum trigynum]|uniref:Aminotransferase class I/classII large domain-containing protein n=1 Tax=Linum trigynum TaxID=586398 RepID=A0AAV2EQK4_9ROSI
MAKLNNIRVKGLLLTKPSNPLGMIIDGDSLRSIAAFTNEKNIHLICDEIYFTTSSASPTTSAWPRSSTRTGGAAAARTVST